MLTNVPYHSSIKVSHEKRNLSLNDIYTEAIQQLDNVSLCCTQFDNELHEALGSQLWMYGQKANIKAICYFANQVTSAYNFDLQINCFVFFVKSKNVES